MSGDWTGDVDFLAAAQGMLAAITDGLEDGADIILADAIPRVPVDGRPDTDGRLLSESGHVDRQGKRAVSITFDGPYAAYISEDLELRHPHGGTGKYLEIAVNEKTDEALDAVAKRMEAAE